MSIKIHEMMFQYSEHSKSCVLVNKHLFMYIQFYYNNIKINISSIYMQHS